MSYFGNDVETIKLTNQNFSGINMAVANITTTNLITTNFTSSNVVITSITSSNLRTNFRLIVGSGVSGDTSRNLSIQAQEARLKVYNQGSVAEWLLGQKNITSHNLAFTKTVSGVESEFLTIKTDGNIGINKPDPLYKLDLVGTSRFEGGDIYCTNTKLGMAMVNDGSGWITVRNNDGLNFMTFIRSSDGAAIGSIFQNGFGGTTFSATSDYRLKENVSKLTLE